MFVADNIRIGSFQSTMFNHSSRIECKITPGMELFLQQYFTEQYIILTSTEEGHEKD